MNEKVSQESFTLNSVPTKYNMYHKSGKVL